MCDLIYISFPVKLKLFKSLVVSILLYGWKGWTLTADLERRIQTFEHKCYRRLLSISYTEHRTNEVVRQQVTNYAASKNHSWPRSSDGNWLGMATSPVSYLAFPDTMLAMLSALRLVAGSKHAPRAFDSATWQAGASSDRGIHKTNQNARDK